MLKQLRALPLIASAAVMTSGPAFAHHSQVMFDSTQCLELTGTVRNWEFGFPHSWLWLWVPNDQGQPDIWGFESASPAQMIEREARWSNTIVKKGDKVVVRYSPMKDGRHGGQLNALTLSSGDKLMAATPACANGSQTTLTQKPATSSPAN